jgi:hypothetical protein
VPARLDLLADETPSGSSDRDLKLTLDAYPRWAERLSHPELLRAFLASCSSSVPYYRQLFGDHPGGLEQYPIIDRVDHDTNRSAFLSSAFEHHGGDSLWIYTNGTFGRSLRVSLDLPSIFDLNHASYLRFSTVLPGLFPTLVPGEPSVFVIADSPRDLRASVVMPALDGTILRILVLGRDEATDTALVDYLRSARIALLHSKPSVLLKLTEIDSLHGGGRRIAPANIVCSGENLYADDRARIEEWLGTPVLDAYVASEAGLVAFECAERSGMHVVDGHLTMEVVGDDGRIKATGTGDLLITNALNWRHAFIRYRIGDTATVSAGRCACGHNGQTIVALPGRERAAYNYGENVVAAADIAAVIEACDPPVKQYQVAYGEDGQITIKWIPDPSTPPARRSRTLAAAMQECFPGTRFELSRVTTINTPGGKLRRFL